MTSNKRWLLILTVVITVLLLAACSSDDTKDSSDPSDLLSDDIKDSFKRSSWGDTVEDVIKEEEKQNNTNYEEEEPEDAGSIVKSLLFKDITIEEQEIIVENYIFTDEVDGEQRDEPVLDEIVFFGIDDEESVERVSDYLKEQYGEAEVESGPIGSILKWSVGDTDITFEEYGMLLYERKQED